MISAVLGAHPLVDQGVKPAGFTGYPGGRPVMPAVPANAMAAASPLQQAVAAATTPAGQQAQFSDLAGLARRRDRQRAGIGNVNEASPEQIAWARAHALLPGPAARRKQQSAGSQLANIRWHGHPAGAQGALSVLDPLTLG